MKQLITKVFDLASLVLPFWGKKNTTKMKEFSELIVNQYEFLVIQLEKVFKDYFDLSDRVKDMHVEIYKLREEIIALLGERCSASDCNKRIYKKEI